MVHLTIGCYIYYSACFGAVVAGLVVQATSWGCNPHVVRSLIQIRPNIRYRLLMFIQIHALKVSPFSRNISGRLFLPTVKAWHIIIPQDVSIVLCWRGPVFAFHFHQIFFVIGLSAKFVRKVWVAKSGSRCAVSKIFFINKESWVKHRSLRGFELIQLSLKTWGWLICIKLRSIGLRQNRFNRVGTLKLPF